MVAGPVSRRERARRAGIVTVKPIEILGGESVYCINEAQLKTAADLAFHNPKTSPRILAEIERLEVLLTRNERASLAFVLIDRLLKSAPAEQPQISY